MINNPQDMLYRSQLGKDRGLQDIANKKAFNDPESIRYVAKQFESLFINMMMKNMRQSNAVFGEDSIFSSQQTKFYEQMYDEQLSKEIAMSKGIGLADVLVRQLGGDKPKRAAEGEGERADMTLPDRIGIPKVSANTKEDSVQSSSSEGQLRATLESLIDVRDSNRMIEIEDANQDDRFRKANLNNMSFGIGDLNHYQREFIDKVGPWARRSAQMLGLDVKVLLAQSALETGWGRHIIEDANGNSSFNIFSIKADKRWNGASVDIDTIEYRDGQPLKERASFRAYSSFPDAISDYVNFLKSNPRYDKALNMTHDPEQYVAELQKAGYATDPKYAEKIMSIYSRISGVEL